MTGSIRTMRYDEVGQVLTVDFRDWAGTTRYFEVAPAEWAKLNAVFQKAAYLQQVLQPRHRSEQMQAA
ncbi:KTSC domain-containing protein [Terriglobus roseus]|uniref:KTSC domain-containing protein n=1 Tax=Terriglobus roseus TaxID=392734 RepID=A0A1H4N934_9BACT|nr:KTSC domain-containing protein [Terriglobus roseus]SEB91950.1 KTSC domain-containing protein [Terriglobus roseus]